MKGTIEVQHAAWVHPRPEGWKPEYQARADALFDD
jgi:hypothetical protein